MSKGGRPKAPLTLSDDERQKLETWASRPKTTQRLALRARIVLACADGLNNTAIAARLRVHPDRRQVAAAVPRRPARRAGRRAPARAPRTITDAESRRSSPGPWRPSPRHATHWSTRGMARATGLSQTAIVRIWRAFGLKPHRARRSSSRPTRTSSRRSGTSSGCT